MNPIETVEAAFHIASDKILKHENAILIVPYSYFQYFLVQLNKHYRANNGVLFYKGIPVYVRSDGEEAVTFTLSTHELMVDIDIPKSTVINGQKH